MENDREIQKTRERNAPIEMHPEEFRRLGHLVVDQITEFLSSLRMRRVTPGEPLEAIRQALQADRPLPERGTDPERLLRQSAELLPDSEPRGASNQG